MNVARIFGVWEGLIPFTPAVEIWSALRDTTVCIRF